MAYEKQTWVDNETPINAERLNHMENGIANAESNVVYVNVEEDFASEEDREAFFEAIDSGKIPVGSLNGWMCYKYEKINSVSFKFSFYGIDKVPVWNEDLGKYMDEQCFCVRTASCSINSGTRWYLTSPSAIFQIPYLPQPPENL